MPTPSSALYRQHQRLAAAGIHVSRAALTSWVHRTGELLEPVYEAQLSSILASRMLAMDETPIRAGRQKSKPGKPGKMKTGYFWPVYGDRDEVAFPFAPTRAHHHVEAIPGDFSFVSTAGGVQRTRGGGRRLRRRVSKTLQRRQV